MLKPCFSQIVSVSITISFFFAVTERFQFDIDKTNKICIAELPRNICSGASHDEPGSWGLTRDQEKDKKT